MTLCCYQDIICVNKSGLLWHTDSCYDNVRTGTCNWCTNSYQHQGNMSSRHSDVSASDIEEELFPWNHKILANNKIVRLQEMYNSSSSLWCSNIINLKRMLQNLFVMMRENRKIRRFHTFDKIFFFIQYTDLYSKFLRNIITFVTNSS